MKPGASSGTAEILARLKRLEHKIFCVWTGNEMDSYSPDFYEHGPQKHPRLPSTCPYCDKTVILDEGCTRPERGV